MQKPGATKVITLSNASSRSLGKVSVAVTVLFPGPRACDDELAADPRSAAAKESKLKVPPSFLAASAARAAGALSGWGSEAGLVTCLVAPNVVVVRVSA